MQNRTNAFVALAILGGFLGWRNRFAIQRRLDSMGLKSPLFKGSLEEAAQSVAAKAAGKMERGATMAENVIRRTAV